MTERTVPTANNEGNLHLNSTLFLAKSAEVVCGDYLPFRGKMEGHRRLHNFFLYCLSVRTPIGSVFPTFFCSRTP